MPNSEKISNKIYQAYLKLIQNKTSSQDTNKDLNPRGKKELPFAETPHIFIIDIKN